MTETKGRPQEWELATAENVPEGITDAPIAADLATCVMHESETGEPFMGLIALDARGRCLCKYGPLSSEEAVGLLRVLSSDAQFIFKPTGKVQ